MSSSTLDAVRSDALRLPAMERAELAQSLVASLDGNTDENAAHEWDIEIVRRLNQIDGGTAQLIDRQEFSRRLQARLKQP